MSLPPAPELGPVDVVLVAFEGDKFRGEIAEEVLKLTEAGIIRILDLVFIRKGFDGEITTIELDDPELSSALEPFAEDAREVLSEDDLLVTAEELEPGTAALVLVWENSWAARLAGAMRRAGGQLVAAERIPADVVMDALAAIEDEE